MLTNRPNLGFGRGTRVFADPLAINDDFARSCVDTSLSSITGSGSSAVVNLWPRTQQSQFHSGGRRWVEFCARLTGMVGYSGRFRVYRIVANVQDGSDWAWPSTRRPMFSLDGGLTWTYFDNCTVNTGGGYAEFWNNAAFAASTILVSRSRLVSVPQAGDWVSSLAAAYPGIVVPAASALAYTPSGDVSAFAAQDFICNEIDSQTDERGRTSGKLPLYAVRINNTGLSPSVLPAKRHAFWSAGVHAGEDLADWNMRAAVTKLLDGSTESNNLLREIDLTLYPLVNVAGRNLGGYRGTWTVYTGGRDDINRNMNTSGLMEPVDKMRAAISTDRAGEAPIFGMDFHGTGQYPFGMVQDPGNAYHSTFKSRLEGYTGFSLQNEGATNDGHLAAHYRDLGAALHVTLEIGDTVPLAGSDLANCGQGVVKTLRDAIVNGEIT